MNNIKLAEELVKLAENVCKEAAAVDSISIVYRDGKIVLDFIESKQLFKVIVDKFIDKNKVFINSDDFEIEEK